MSDQQFLAIGDVHGCLQSLNGLLKKLSDYSGYTYIFVGDYIDRGPDSKGVIDRLLDFREEQKMHFSARQSWTDAAGRLLQQQFGHVADEWRKVNVGLVQCHLR